MTGNPIDDVRYERFRALADVLIPGGHGLPPAGDTPDFRRSVDRVLTLRPDLAAVVWPALDGGDDPATRLAALRAQDAAAFDLFGYAVAAAYLTTPRVRRLLGYPGNAPRPEPPHEGEAEYYLEDGLLDPVLARGPFYRSVT